MLAFMTTMLVQRGHVNSVAGDGALPSFGTQSLLVLKQPFASSRHIRQLASRQ